MTTGPDRTVPLPQLLLQPCVVQNTSSYPISSSSDGQFILRYDPHYLFFISPQSQSLHPKTTKTKTKKKKEEMRVTNSFSFTESFVRDSDVPLTFFFAVVRVYLSVNFHRLPVEDEDRISLWETLNRLMV